MASSDVHSQETSANGRRWHPVGSMTDFIPHRVTLLDSWLSGLDFTPPDDEDVPDDAPIIIVTHGLTGGSPIVDNHQCITLTDSRFPRIVRQSDLSARGNPKIRRRFRLQGRRRQLSRM
jgi:hypothetical protein